MKLNQLFLFRDVLIGAKLLMGDGNWNESIDHSGTFYFCYID